MDEKLVGGVEFIVLNIGHIYVILTLFNHIVSGKLYAIIKDSVNNAIGLVI